MNKREAIREVRALANMIIEQRTRQAKGWDRGVFRDDDTGCRVPINCAMHRASREAFYIASLVA